MDWKYYTERVMNFENYLNFYVGVDTVDPVDCVNVDEVMWALNELKM